MGYDPQIGVAVVESIVVLVIDYEPSWRRRDEAMQVDGAVIGVSAHYRAAFSHVGIKARAARVEIGDSPKPEAQNLVEPGRVDQYDMQPPLAIRAEEKRSRAED